MYDGLAFFERQLVYRFPITDRLKQLSLPADLTVNSRKLRCELALPLPLIEDQELPTQRPISHRFIFETM